MFGKTVGEDVIQTWKPTVANGRACLTFGCRVLSHESQVPSAPLHPDIEQSCLRNPMLIHMANNVVDYYKRLTKEEASSKYVQLLILRKLPCSNYLGDKIYLSKDLSP